MKVCGFTFVKNAVKFDFPIIESIQSVLPLCDKFIVAVGDCNDGTKQLIEGIDNKKVEIIYTAWDETQKAGGRVYALETNKAFDAIPEEYDWCFYIQADEVIHEKDHQIILDAMQKWLLYDDIEGLLFKYYHFFGSYDYVGDTRKWYRNEIRVIRNNKQIRSYRDAQGFRKEGKKLSVIPIDAYIYHYGWVRPPLVMQQKNNAVKRYYSGEIIENTEYEFDYEQSFDALAEFKETHPAVMQNRIAVKNWRMKVDTTRIRMNLKYKILYWIEKKFGKRLFEYRNYNINPRSSN